MTDTWLAELDGMDARLAPYFGRREVKRGFVLLPRRWVVERDFG